MLEENAVKHIYTSTRTARELAEAYGVSIGTVNQLRAGKSYKRFTSNLVKPELTSHKKLTDADVRAIRRSPLSLSKLAKEYGVSPSMVSRIKNGHRRAEA